MPRSRSHKTSGDVFDTPRAAEYLGVSFKTLERWRTESFGPTFTKVGRCVRYRKPDLDAWLAERRATGTTS